MFKKIYKVRDTLAPAYMGDCWTKHNEGRYTVGSGFEWLIGTQPRVNWYLWVWNSANIPKHSFICWLICHKRVKTRDKLKTYGVVNDNRCLVCEADEESCSHLFFKCVYSCRIMDAWKNRMKMSCRSSDLMRIES